MGLRAARGGPSRFVGGGAFVHAGRFETTSTEGRMASGPRIPFSGILLVVLGGLFLADQMGALHVGQVFHTWWPAILVIAGLLHLIEKPAAPFMPLVILGIGVALLLSNLHVIQIASVWRLWPIVLIAIGFNILLGHRGK
jgi:hypothetical protein